MIKTIERYRKTKRRTLKSNKNVVSAPPNPDHVQIELPQEVIFSEILTRLPVSSLFRFKLVSKPWNSIISTPKFIKSHLSKTISNPYVPSNCVFIKTSYVFYILNYGAYDRCPDDHRGEKGLNLAKDLIFGDNDVNTFLIGSCNGLVCFGRGSASNIYGYRFHFSNPLMGENCECEVSDPLANFESVLMCGFGYVSCKDDYLLFVAGLQRRTDENFAYVFSLKAKIWRKIGVFKVGKLFVFTGGRGVLVNETLHWNMTQVWTPNVKCVCGFDLVSETFKDVEMPRPFWRAGVNLGLKLCEISGCLGAWTSVSVNGVVEMWMLKQYGVWDSWMRLFKIDLVSGFCNFCGWTENGKVLVLTEDGSLLLADPNQTPTGYRSLVNGLGEIDVMSFVRSPVSPLF